MKHLQWQDLNQFDIFISIIKESDNIADYAIGIYNNQMFDPNEEVVILLCQGRLDYCMKTKDARNKSVSSIEGFFFRKVFLK